MITLGQKAKDKITGFEGILTARYQYITGCDCYVITSSYKNKEQKGGEAFSYDEGRIQILGKGIPIKELRAKEDGGPKITTSVMPTHAAVIKHKTLSNRVR